MEGYDKETYGAAWASDYDRVYPDVAEGMIDLLEELAAGGRVLELAIGTGRVALPLRARGVDISGIDISPEMTGLMRKKPGGEDVPIVIGDFADVELEGTVRLVYLVFNTLFALDTQAAQARCFANVARRLEPHGRFVVEAFVPDLGRFDRGQRVQVNHIDRGVVALDVSEHDLATQQVKAQWIELSDKGVKLRPVFLRYSWPSELDLMARLAGLELEQRWGGWRREPFTSASPRHVSVYRVAGA
jgi:SAM-dependent methyltransferase